MKSIVEEASSILKAIEKAWNRAKQPKDFSIKVFEKEVKNFFGFTKKPAKVGLFYTEQRTESTDKQRYPKKRYHQPRRTSSGNRQYNNNRRYDKREPFKKNEPKKDTPPSKAS